MLKLIIENATLNDLTPEQLQQLDWKSVTKTDISVASTELVSKNITKLSSSVMRHACKLGKIDPNALSVDEWVDFIREHVRYSEDQQSFFPNIQLPYSVVNEFISRNNYSDILYATQKCIPMDDVIKNMRIHTLDQILRNGSNRGLIDYIFSPEGSELIKEKFKNPRDRLTYIKSHEAEILGFKQKNYTISSEILRRAGACSDGQTYCRRTLKELGLESIKWDDMIEVLRTNKKICARSAVHNYIGWIVDRRNDLARNQNI